MSPNNRNHITLPHLIQYVLSSVLLLGVAPFVYVTWFSWRIITSPLPVWIYQKGEDFIYATYQKTVLFFFLNVTGTKVYFSGNWQVLKKKKERVIYLANHQSNVDWILTNVVTMLQKSTGQLRYILKDTIQYVPLYGHYLYQHGCIYVNRGNFKADKMMQGLDYLKNSQIPSWVVIFPEGTFFHAKAKDTIELSRQRARDNNLPVLEHHLTPKSRGMYLVLKELRGYIDAVYDITVVYGGTVSESGERSRAPGIRDFLLGKCPYVNFHCKRIPIEDVPTNESDLKLWMHNLFVEKDKIVQNFYSLDHEIRKSAMEGSTERPVRLYHTIPSVLLTALITLPVFMVDCGWSLYLQIAFCGCLGGYLWLAVKAVC